MRLILAFLMALLFCSNVAVAQDQEKPLTITDHFSSLIYDGERAQEGELPEVVWIGNCTATLVAPDVVYTAAHCVYTGKRVDFEHETGNYNATCTEHPDYNNRTVYNDYALCKLDSPVPEGTHMASFDPSGVAEDEKLLVNGYGRPNLVNLYWGEAGVRRIRGQDIVTCGPSNLGSGDSGGSLMRWTDDLTDATVRQVVGTNSRAGGGCSYFNRVSHENFTSWAREYQTDEGVELCGFARDCSGEDDGGDDPDDPEDPDCSGKLDLLQEAQDAAAEKLSALRACLAG